MLVETRLNTNRKWWFINKVADWGRPVNSIGLSSMASNYTSTNQWSYHVYNYSCMNSRGISYFLLMISEAWYRGCTHWPVQEGREATWRETAPWVKEGTWKSEEATIGECNEVHLPHTGTFLLYLGKRKRKRGSGRRTGQSCQFFMVIVGHLGWQKVYWFLLYNHNVGPFATNERGWEFQGVGRSRRQGGCGLLVTWLF